jgi:hypothetical protein
MNHRSIQGGPEMGLLQALFAGYKAANEEKIKQREYDHLLYTPFLHSPEYLKDLYNQADNIDQEDCVIDHINRHKVYEVGAYGKLYDKHVDRRWK